MTSVSAPEITVEWLGAGRYYLVGSIWYCERRIIPGQWRSVTFFRQRPELPPPFRLIDHEAVIAHACAALGLPVASAYSGLSLAQVHGLKALSLRLCLPCADGRIERRRWMRKPVVSYTFVSAFCRSRVRYRGAYV